MSQIDKVKKVKAKTKPNGLFKNRITDGGVFFDGKKFLLSNHPNFYTSKKILDIFNNHKFSSSPRQSGIYTTTEAFGWLPENYVFNHPTRIAKLHTSHPKLAFILKKLAEKVSEEFKRQCPSQYKIHKEIVEQISGDFFLGNSVFTSGVLNKNTQIDYHTDSGNLNGCFGAMLTFKSGDKGGYLNFPEYEATLMNEHGNLVIFDNQSILHGVSEIPKNQTRYTIVFFVLNNLKKYKDKTECVKAFNKKISQKHIGTENG